MHFAGGCFWGTEHFFHQIKGVVSTKTGYANGNIDNPSYDMLYADDTGYAETVEVRYDRDRLPLAKLLRMYFTAIDPTSVNRQGEDSGTRYRTGIYYSDPNDLQTILKEYEELRKDLGCEPAVEVEALGKWYPAEEYHQAYLKKNPEGYCHLPVKLFAYAKMFFRSGSDARGRAGRDREDGRVHGDDQRKAWILLDGVLCDRSCRRFRRGGAHSRSFPGPCSMHKNTERKGCLRYSLG